MMVRREKERGNCQQLPGMFQTSPAETGRHRMHLQFIGRSAVILASVLMSEPLKAQQPQPGLPG